MRTAASASLPFSLCTSSLCVRRQYARKHTCGMGQAPTQTQCMCAMCHGPYPRKRTIYRTPQRMHRSLTPRLPRTSIAPPRPLTPGPVRCSPHALAGLHCAPQTIVSQSTDSLRAQSRPPRRTSRYTGSYVASTVATHSRTAASSVSDSNEASAACTPAPTSAARAARSDASARSARQPAARYSGASSLSNSISGAHRVAVIAIDAPLMHSAACFVAEPARIRRSLEDSARGPAAGGSDLSCTINDGIAPAAAAALAAPVVVFRHTTMSVQSAFTSTSRHGDLSSATSGGSPPAEAIVHAVPPVSSARTRNVATACRCTASVGELSPPIRAGIPRAAAIAPLFAATTLM